MGTTCTIAGFLDDTLYLAQVGDSRGYLIRNGVAQQITKDQSLMQKLVEAGELTAEEAEVSERRNIILQALGPEAIVKVDLTSQQVRRGDTLLLCSDGLSGQMRAGDIARIVNEDPNLVTLCRKLIDLANENGGPDNITVIAARFEGSGLEPPSPDEGPAYQPYTSQSEQRITQPVDVTAIAAIAEDDVDRDASMLPAEPTEPTEPTEPMEPRRTPASDMSAASPAASTNPRSAVSAEDARVSIAKLRLVFGAIAVAIGAVVVYSLLRK
jgi:hypothetical protein